MTLGYGAANVEVTVALDLPTELAYKDSSSLIVLLNSNSRERNDVYLCSRQIGWGPTLLDGGQKRLSSCGILGLLDGQKLVFRGRADQHGLPLLSLLYFSVLSGNSRAGPDNMIQGPPFLDKIYIWPNMVLDDNDYKSPDGDTYLFEGGAMTPPVAY